MSPTRLPLLALVALSALSLAALGVAAQTECSWNGFDLSSLTTQDWQGSDGGQTYEYFLHVCGPLTNESSCTSIMESASTCQIQVNPKGQSFVTGAWSDPEWSFINPEDPDYGIQYTINGAQACWASGSPADYVSNVQFVCGETQGPLQVIVPNLSCVMNFSMVTPLACSGGPGPSPTPTCGFGGFDFSSLARTDLKGSDGGSTYQYALRVCGSLDAATYPECTTLSSEISACQTQVQPQGASFDIGNVNTMSAWAYVNPSEPTQGVFYSMTGDQSCWANGSATDFEINVQFLCNQELSVAVSVPAGSCSQTWTVYTPLACSSSPSSSCGWNGYDFSSLAGSDLTGSDGIQTYAYYLRLCGPVQTQPACTQVSATASACQVQVQPAGPSFVNGEWVAPVTWSYIDASQPALGVTYQMVGAQSCWATGSPTDYVTNVNLKCAQDEAPMTVVYESSSPCYYNYSVFTPLACPPAPLETPLIAWE